MRAWRKLWCARTGRAAESGASKRSWCAVPEWLLGVRVGATGRTARTRNGTTTSGGSGGGTVREIVGVAVLVFEQDGAYVIDGDVDGVCDTRDGENSLGGARQHGLACSETGTRGFLDFFDLGTLLANDGAHAGVGHNKTDGDGFGARDRGLVKGLVVDPADDQTECLRWRVTEVRMEKKFRSE